MLEYYRFKVIHNLFLKGQTEAACMQLRELQKRYVALCEENAAFKANVREFEDILFMERNFSFDGRFYWLRTGNIRQGPFCPDCYNRHGQITRLTGLRVPLCPVCGAVFEAAPGVSRAEREESAIRSLRALAQEQVGLKAAEGAPVASVASAASVAAVSPRPGKKTRAVLLPFTP